MNEDTNKKLLAETSARVSSQISSAVDQLFILSALKNNGEKLAVETLEDCLDSTVEYLSAFRKECEHEELAFLVEAINKLFSELAYFRLRGRLPIGFDDADNRTDAILRDKKRNRVNQILENFLN